MQLCRPTCDARLNRSASRPTPFVYSYLQSLNTHIIILIKFKQTRDLLRTLDYSSNLQCAKFTLVQVYVSVVGAKKLRCVCARGGASDSLNYFCTRQELYNVDTKTCYICSASQKKARRANTNKHMRARRPSRRRLAERKCSQVCDRKG